MYGIPEGDLTPSGADAELPHPAATTNALDSYLLQHVVLKNLEALVTHGMVRFTYMYMYA